MANVTSLGNQFNTTTGSHGVIGTPALNDLIIIIAANTGYTNTLLPTDNNADGLGTYKEVTAARALKATSADTLQVYVRNSPIGSATSTTFAHVATGSSGGGFIVLKVTGMSLFALQSIRQAAIQSNQGAGTPAPVFSVAPLTGNPVIGAVFNATNAATMTPRTSFTEVADVGYATPTTGFEAMTRNSGETATTQTWGSASASAFCSMVIELDTTVPAVNLVQALKVTGSGEADVSGSFTTLPTVGNTIIVTVAAGGPSGPEGTPTDNQGNSYTAIGTRQSSSAGQTLHVYRGRVLTSAGTFTITVPRSNPGGGGWGADLGLHEFSGPVTSPVDQQIVNTGTSATSSSGALTPTLNATTMLVAEIDEVPSDAGDMTPADNFSTVLKQKIISTQNRFTTALRYLPDKTAVTGSFTLTASANWAVKAVNLTAVAADTTRKTDFFSFFPLGR